METIKQQVDSGKLLPISHEVVDWKDTFQIEDYQRLLKNVPEGETRELSVHDVDSKVLCRAPLQAFEDSDMTGDFMHDNDNDNIFWDIRSKKVVVAYKGIIYSIGIWENMWEEMDEDECEKVMENWPLEKNAD